MKRYSVRLDLYVTMFHFIDCNSRDKIFKKYGIEFNEIGGVASLSGTDIYIFINTKYKNWSLDIFVHECVHAANELFLSLKMEHDKKNDESFAYLVGWIFMEGYYNLLKK